MSDNFFDQYRFPNGGDGDRPNSEPDTAQTNPAPAPYQAPDPVSAAPAADPYEIYRQDDRPGDSAPADEPAKAVNSVYTDFIGSKPYDTGGSDNVFAKAPAADEIGTERTVVTNPAPFVMPPFNTPAPAQEPQKPKTDLGDGFYHSAYSSQPVPENRNVNPYTTEGNAGGKHGKKAKKAKGSSGIAFILVICILLSLVSGFGGSLLANHFVKSADSKSGDKDDSSLKLNVVDTETVDYSALEDKPTTDITTEVADTVVEITTESMQTSTFYGQYISQGAGSGVIISDDGYILTNNHVIEGATSITVTTRSGEVYEGKLVGTDSEVDIALLKIEATGLSKATLGDSSTLKVGSKAVIIGNPLGTLGGSVTEGIISALDRSIAIDGKTMHLMQTDAAINPGNSGGGMFDGQGLLAGIVVAKSSSEEIDNIGFVIPINIVKEILGDLKDYGYVRGRASTGMEFMDMSNPMFAWYYYRSTESGVYVSNVKNGSNAASAGFKKGDLVVSVDGQTISSSDDITSIISGKSAGDTVNFVVKRNGAETTLTLTLDEYVPEGITAGNSTR